MVKFKEAMDGSDRAKWEEAVKEEHNKMKKYNVWKHVKIHNVLVGSKILTST